MDKFTSHGGSVCEMFAAQNPQVDIKLAILHTQFKNRSTSPNLRGFSTNHICQPFQKSFIADMCINLKKH